MKCNRKQQAIAVVGSAAGIITIIIAVMLSTGNDSIRNLVLYVLGPCPRFPIHPIMINDHRNFLVEARNFYADFNSNCF